MIMLDAIKGFTVETEGAEPLRVEPGQRLDDDFADAATIDHLLSRGAIVPVIDDTRPARASKKSKSSPNTPKVSQGATEAQSGGEE